MEISNFFQICVGNKKIHSDILIIVPRGSWQVVTHEYHLKQ